MKINKRKTIIIVAVLFLFGALPIIPVAKVLTNDPETLSDKRVKINLTDQDMNEIMRKVRGGRYMSLYSAILGKLGISRPLMPVLSIYNRSIGERETVVVRTGYRCGPLCGGGISFYLHKEGDDWVIIDESIWEA